MLLVLKFQIRAEIERRIQELCGENPGISKEAITVNIYAPDVFDQTIIDLPGFAKNEEGKKRDGIGYLLS